MSQKQVFTCDECGAQKKETEFWVLGAIGQIRAAPMALVMPWNEEDAKSKDASHFCGTPHAQVWVGKRINEWQQGEK